MLFQYGRPVLAYIIALLSIRNINQPIHIFRLNEKYVTIGLYQFFFWNIYTPTYLLKICSI